jgi:hypothetical protein
MKLIFSRKGFDSGSGGAASPIVAGRPISLPIPTKSRSYTTYGDLELGEHVERATRGRLNRTSLCHLDPMFEGGRCAFGQTSTAQAHLHNQGVGVGDVFLFFGLFSDLDGSNRHHRIFGYLEVDAVTALGAAPDASSHPSGFSRQHPHTIGEWNPNNTIYLGPGRVATLAHDELRLSRAEQVSLWRVPSWLCAAGLTYHSKGDRWIADDTLLSAARGQEFVSDISGIPVAHRWLENVRALIDADGLGDGAHG